MYIPGGMQTHAYDPYLLSHRLSRDGRNHERDVQWSSLGLKGSVALQPERPTE